MKRLFILGLILLFFILFPSLSFAQSPSDWYMLGANPQRTSWVSEGPTGTLRPLWYKPIEPYVSPRTQIIISNDTLYLSTAKGLYAFDANTGSEKWVYATELPLGHSPTIVNGVAYVGGFDRQIHAINTSTGLKIWSFTAEQGFQTNPLVVNNTVYAGNRDGYFYALNSADGSLKWKYKTGGPILFSAAYENNVIYFASNDMFAYALNATDGSLIWKSQKLLGAGFTSWWPVIYQNYVVFAGSHNYRHLTVPFGGQVNNNLDKIYVYKDHTTLPRGTLVGPISQEPGNWATGTVTLDTSKFTASSSGITRPITEYYEEMPWRRTDFVLSKTTGQEYTTDFDNDGKPEYAPFLWFGTHSGNRYPPIVGSDNVIYQTNSYQSDQWIPGGQIVGWKIGTPFISFTNCDWGAVDEPHAYSGGGNNIYWSLIGDRQAGGFSITNPRQIDIAYYNAFKTFKCSRNNEWSYFDYNLTQYLPDYFVGTAYGGVDPYCTWCNDQAVASFADPKGVYSWHYEVSPPIPYKGKIYTLNTNGITAWGTPAPNCTTTNCLLPKATKPAAINNQINIPTQEQLKVKLNEEVQKIVDVGHLRPGYLSSGIFDQVNNCGVNNLVDYFHEPWDTFYTLQKALPYLSSSLQTNVRNYIQQEFNGYPFYKYWHVGWVNGSKRETGDTPPEFTANIFSYPAQTEIYPINYNNERYPPWNFPPHAFYYLWQYAKEFGNPLALFNSGKANNSLMTALNNLPTDAILIERPYFLNSYIAGYIGFLGLEKLIGQPESTVMKTQLDRLMNLRKNNFTVYPEQTFDRFTGYCKGYTVSRNFLYMVPELAQYLSSNNSDQVRQALIEYERITPYWFVSRFESTTGEGGTHHLYDYASLFQAKAYILKEPYEELVKYLDVPAFAVGDLFYIQNLVAVLSAASGGGSPTPTPISEGDLNNDGKIDISDLILLLFNYQTTDMKYDLNKDGGVNVFDSNILLLNYSK